MDRPALPRLLAEVTADRVDIVVVYKIDRLTRPLVDFAQGCGGLTAPTRQRYTEAGLRRAPPSRHRADDDHAPLGDGMRQPRADLSVDRRGLLKFSGTGAIAASTGGVAAILASSGAPIYEEATSIHWLRWSDFVPASD